MSFVVFAPLDKPVHLRLCKNQPVAIVIEETEDRCTRGVQREHLVLSAAHQHTIPEPIGRQKLLDCFKETGYENSPLLIPSPLTSQGKITIIPVEICPDCNSHTGIGSRYESVFAKACMIRSLHGVPQGYLFLYSFIWKTWMVEKTHTAVWDRPSMEGPLSWPVFDVNVECTAWGVHWSKPGLSVPFHPSKHLKSALFRDLFGKLA